MKWNPRRGKILFVLLLVGIPATVAKAQMAWREDDRGGVLARQGVEKAGPQGNAAGEPFDDTPFALGARKAIRRVWGRAGDIVDGLQALNGREEMPYHGGEGGTAWGFRLEPGDYLTEVRGIYGNWYGNIFVSQLTFITAEGRIYGPFGKDNSVTETQVIRLKAPPGRQIVAFTGSTGTASESDGSVSTFLASLGAVFGPVGWNQ